MASVHIRLSSRPFHAISRSRLHVGHRAPYPMTSSLPTSKVSRVTADPTRSLGRGQSSHKRRLTTVSSRSRISTLITSISPRPGTFKHKLCKCRMPTPSVVPVPPRIIQSDKSPAAFLPSAPLSDCFEGVLSHNQLANQGDSNTIFLILRYWDKTTRRTFCIINKMQNVATLVVPTETQTFVRQVSSSPRVVIVRFY